MGRLSKLFGKKDELKQAFKSAAGIKSVKDQGATLDAEGIRKVSRMANATTTAFAAIGRAAAN